MSVLEKIMRIENLIIKNTIVSEISGPCISSIVESCTEPYALPSLDSDINEPVPEVITEEERGIPQTRVCKDCKLDVDIKYFCVSSKSKRCNKCLYAYKNRKGYFKSYYNENKEKIIEHQTELYFKKTEPLVEAGIVKRHVPPNEKPIKEKRPRGRPKKVVFSVEEWAGDIDIYEDNVPQNYPPGTMQAREYDFNLNLP